MRQSMRAQSARLKILFPAGISHFTSERSRAPARVAYATGEALVIAQLHNSKFNRGNHLTVCVYGPEHNIYSRKLSRESAARTNGKLFNAFQTQQAASAAQSDAK
jgi:hypothetical protein